MRLPVPPLSLVLVWCKSSSQSFSSPNCLAEQGFSGLQRIQRDFWGIFLIERWLLAAKLPDNSCGLQHDPRGHLRLACCAVRENDRHLDDLEPRTMTQVVHLDLKPVTVGAHVV